MMTFDDAIFCAAFAFLAVNTVLCASAFLALINGKSTFVTRTLQHPIVMLGIFGATLLATSYVSNEDWWTTFVLGPIAFLAGVMGVRFATRPSRRECLEPVDDCDVCDAKEGAEEGDHRPAALNGRR